MIDHSASLFLIQQLSNDIISLCKGRLFSDTPTFKVYCIQAVALPTAEDFLIMDLKIIEKKGLGMLSMSIIIFLASVITSDYDVLIHIRVSMTALIPINYILLAGNSCCHIQDVKKHHEPTSMLFDSLHIYLYVSETKRDNKLTRNKKMQIDVK